MEQNEKFYKTVWKIALPVTLQFLLQSSFSVVDQVMTGQLGSVSVAGIGLAGKFASIFSVLVSAVAAAAGIMLAQYIGQQDKQKADRSFFVNLAVTGALALLFTGACIAGPHQIMGLYTQDSLTCDAAGGYLRIYAVSYLPMAVTALCSTYLRCAEAAALPLIAGIAAAVVNTLLNYVLIFGKAGFPALGINGAAAASAAAQVIGCALTLGMLWSRLRRQKRQTQMGISEKKEKLGQLNLLMKREERRQYLGILLPILGCELFWSLGENVYAAIYGHIGGNHYRKITWQG